jgi:hypothetical protein
MLLTATQPKPTLVVAAGAREIAISPKLPTPGTSRLVEKYASAASVMAMGCDRHSPK